MGQLASAVRRQSFFVVGAILILSLRVYPWVSRTPILFFFFRHSVFLCIVWTSVAEDQQ